MKTTDRLQPIVADVTRRLEERRRQVPEAELEQRALAVLTADPRRSLLAAIQGGRSRPVPPVVAEIKRGSPAAGDLGRETDGAARAQVYARAGAAAISVVTEPDHFHGDPGDLARVRPVGLPVLRKDFIVSRYQLLESVLLGADVVLLIARILTGEQLKSLMEDAAGLGLECLVEINDEDEAAMALRAGANLIGINNRDLRNFTIDIGRTARLLPLVAGQATVISASGMREPEDVVRAHRQGADACLVGGALMRAPDPAAWLEAVAKAAQAAQVPAPGDGGDPGAV